MQKKTLTVFPPFFEYLAHTIDAIIVLFLMHFFLCAMLYFAATKIKPSHLNPPSAGYIIFCTLSEQPCSTPHFPIPLHQTKMAPNDGRLPAECHPFFPAVSEQSFSCEQKVLDSSNAAPPTAHSLEWCCNFHKPPCEAWRVVFFSLFFFSFTFCAFLVSLVRQTHFFQFKSTKKNLIKNKALLLLFMKKIGGWGFV